MEYVEMCIENTQMYVRMFNDKQTQGLNILFRNTFCFDANENMLERNKNIKLTLIFLHGSSSLWYPLWDLSFATKKKVCLNLLFEGHFAQSQTYITCNPYTDRRCRRSINIPLGNSSFFNWFGSFNLIT